MEQKEVEAERERKKSALMKILDAMGLGNTKSEIQEESRERRQDPELRKLLK